MNKIRADLQRIKEEGEVQTEPETTSKRKERRTRVAKLKEKGTTVAHEATNRAHETIEQLEAGLQQDRMVLSNAREARRHIEELVDERVKGENYFI